MQKEITTLADVICFRGGDLDKEKKSPSLRTRISPCWTYREIITRPTEGEK